MGDTQILKATPTGALRAYDNASLIDRFISDLDAKPRTKDAYRKALNYFFSWLDAEGVKDPRREHILTYKAYLMDNYAASTVSSYLTAIRLFFAYINAETGYPNIAANIKNPKTKEGHKKDALSAQQAKDVLGNMKRDTLAEKRDYALVMLLLHTGVRTIETERANIEDIRTNLGATVLYVQGKGKDAKDDYVKVTASVSKAINDYLTEREKVEGKLKDSAPLFASVSRRAFGGRMVTRSISRICKAALKNAGLNSARLTAHSLRHTAVSLPLQAGASIREVQQMARHTSPLTTERYAHDIRRLDDAVEDKLEALLAS